MIRLIIKLAVYFGIFAILELLGWIPELSYSTLALLGLVLALVNTFIRPIISVLMLPLGLLTLGIVSVFVNMLTIVIANAIMGSLLGFTFWPMLLLAIGIMFIDSIIRKIRTSLKFKNRKKQSAKTVKKHRISYTIL